MSICVFILCIKNTNWNVGRLHEELSALIPAVEKGGTFPPHNLPQRLTVTAI
jgi:hypothetical protein